MERYVSLSFLIVVLSVACTFIFVACCYIGYIGRKQLWEDYKDAYRRLDKAIREWEVSPTSFYAIKNGFKDLRTFKCRNEEELNVLSILFYNKYKDLKL